jgi:L-alanine-DL-glutamate epimerase-like enolase superfamily enzyme
VTGDQPPTRHRSQPVCQDVGILDLRVTSVRVDELRFMMNPPLRLAGRSVSARDYVVVQVSVESGATGTAYVLTRGQPIRCAAEALAQSIVGSRLSALFTRDPLHRGTSATARARAVFDNCAWDLVGLLRRVPTWQLLGENPRNQPALLVAGYRRHGENDETMARRLVAWRDAGFRSVKIAADLDDDGTTGVLAAVRQMAPADEFDVVLDLGFAGRSVSAVVDAAQRWAQYGVTWLEDPFPVAAAADTASTRVSCALPIAAGDEASPGELTALLQSSAVDVLRADTTTVGGLSGLADILAMATIPVSLHIYPEIHRHVAVTRAESSPIESFPPADDFDFVDRFIVYDQPPIADGRFAVPPTPGLGLHYRPDTVLHNIIHSHRITAT